MNFSDFNGKTVVVQLRANEVWLTVHQEGGKPAILAFEDAGQHRLVPTPFIVGKVETKENGRSVVVFNDENRQKLEVTLNPDAVLSITEAIEGSKISLIAV